MTQSRETPKRADETAGKVLRREEQETPTQAHPADVFRSVGSIGKLHPSHGLALQASVGNRAVQRTIQRKFDPAEMADQGMQHVDSLARDRDVFVRTRLSAYTQHGGVNEIEHQRGEAGRLESTYR
jgi:hypothetical protein